jgi:hydroxymethylglutaryl-CoA synthase
MKIGIDKIGFYVPKLYLDIETLAINREVDPMKYKKGLMLDKMAVAPLNQDIISMGVNAAHSILTKEDIEKIDMVLFATESSIDQSKAAATHLISLLSLKKNIRALELKHACYALTAAIQFAKNHVKENPESKVLVVGSDIAKYGIKTDGEPTQGAGAIALIISKDPCIAEIENVSGLYADDIYDFWRPSYSPYAMVDGQYSNEMYKKFFLESYEDYLKKSRHKKEDIDAFIFHIPYAKLGLKTLSLIEPNIESNLYQYFNQSIVYNQQVGNIYTGSLYLSLVSLLEQGEMKDNSRIGLFSYGSGAVAEFYTIKLVNGYKNHLNKIYHEKLLENRKALSIESYESLISTHLTNDIKFEDENESYCELKEISHQQRKYSIKAV